MRRLANAIFFLAVAILTAITIPACGGGGTSSLVAQAPPPAIQSLKVHESVVFTGPWSPVANATTVLKTLTFTPTNGVSDMILRIEIDATYSLVAGNGWILFDVLDSTGKYVTSTGGTLMQEVGIGKYLMATSSMESPTLIPVGVSQSSFYTIVVSVYAAAGYSGSVIDFKFKLIVGENATTVVASPAIS